MAPPAVGVRGKRTASKAKRRAQRGAEIRAMGRLTAEENELLRQERQAFHQEVRGAQEVLAMVRGDYDSEAERFHRAGNPPSEAIRAMTAAAEQAAFQRRLQGAQPVELSAILTDRDWETRTS